MAPDAAGDDEAATLRAQLSLVHEKGVALRAQLVREQAARAGLERDLATSRAALEQSRAANAVLQAALDESKAALRRLGERVEASEWEFTDFTVVRRGHSARETKPAVLDQT